jgi:hypothetical protein
MFGVSFGQVCEVEFELDRVEDTLGSLPRNNVWYCMRTKKAIE